MQYTPTEAITNNSMRGLALLQKSNSIKSKAIQTEIEPYVNLLNKGLTKDQVQGLYFALLKARDNYQPKTLLEGYNVTPDTAKFLSLGANAAIAWCSDILQDTQVKKQAANTEDEIRGVPLQVTKAVNTDLMQATFIVMVPNEVDLHCDVISEEEVRKSCHSYNLHSRTANLFHLVETDTFSVVESWISPVDFSLSGKFVKKGTWLCTVQVYDEQLWQLIKCGDICSVSIGAMARVENIEED